MVRDSSAEGDNDNPPNVHPDCVPDPEFRGPRGTYCNNSTREAVPPTAPSDIHLIKRIVRSRPDVENNPRNYRERVWLYRYNDVGFLKAVFDPASVEALISADPEDAIGAPDDILQFSDRYPVGGRPLITYASQWYTYYNPYVKPDKDENGTPIGIPSCSDFSPYLGE